MFIIPLTSEPNQRFRCVVPINGNNVPLLFQLKYNSSAKYWVMTLIDDVTGKILVDSLPLISGVYPSANLLEQCSFLNIGTAVMVKINPDNHDFAANDTNLGTDFKLVWGDNFE